MTLEKHIIDTMKEWQTKIGNFDTSVRLYYPRESLCVYLGLQENIANDELKKSIMKYLREEAAFLGEVAVSYNKERFCIEVGKKGCNYVEHNVPEPEFLSRFLKALSTQDMKKILNVFDQYANEHHTTYICDKENHGLGTVIYFENQMVEAYVYCLEQDVFGITYHRFTMNDYARL